MTSYPTPGYGWRCSICGTWVAQQAQHACGGGGSYSQPDPIGTALSRIEALLQQILRKLETT